MFVWNKLSWNFGFWRVFTVFNKQTCDFSPRNVLWERILLGMKPIPLVERNPSETLMPRRFPAPLARKNIEVLGPDTSVVFGGFLTSNDTFRLNINRFFLRLWTPGEATTKTVTLRSSEVSDIWKLITAERLKKEGLRRCWWGWNFRLPCIISCSRVTFGFLMDHPWWCNRWLTLKPGRTDSQRDFC